MCAGGRGVGKTALAAAYARAAIDDPAGPRVVAWVSGESQLTLTADLSALARRANLNVDGENAEQTAARARDYLTGLEVPSLLVIDNAEHPHQIPRWLPASTACQILLTSTDQTFTALASPIQVGTYTRTQSIDYLAERTRLDDSTGASTIAEAVGDLPLALAQAAGVIEAQGSTYAQYLTKLQTAKLPTALPAVPGYPRGLAETVHLSVQAASARRPLTRVILNLLSVLDSNGISQTLLSDLVRALPDETSDEQTPTQQSVRLAQRSGQVTQEDADDAIAALASVSLVTRTADRSSILIHRLIGRVIRETGAIAQLLDGAAAALRTTIPAEGALPPTLAHIADLAAQTLSLLKHSNHSNLPTRTVHVIYSTATAVGVWLYGVGAYTEMLSISEVTLAAMERVLGPDHPDILKSRSNLALGYWAGGRSAEAVTLWEVTLAARERVLGPEHPDTLGSRNNLAIGYQAVGRSAEAVTLWEVTLAARERVLGPEHPDTLGSRSNLAVGYRAVGRYAEAVTLDEVTLAARERVLGPDHPDTLTSRNNLALGYRAVGRSAEAVSLDEVTLAAMERVLGPDHPNTLTSRSNLALGYRAVGRSAEAVTLDEVTLAARERVLGPDHPDTLKSRSNLALGYWAVGRHDDAERLLSHLGP